MPRPSPILLSLAILVLQALGSGARADRTTPEAVQPHRIRALLVGNSYSRFNDLPEMLEAVASSVRGGPTLETDSAFKAGVGLRTHWREGMARRMLHKGDHTHVVLQGHSRAVFDFPNEFLEYAARFKREADEVEAELVLFTTWARHPSSSLYALGKDARTPLDMQTRIDALYRRAADRIDARVAPVGDAWLIAGARWPHLRLHRPDASHPTLRGTYLTACVLYGTITGRSPTAVRHRPDGLHPGLLAHLRAVAAETLDGPATHDRRRPRIAETEGAADLDAPARTPMQAARGLDAP